MTMHSARAFPIFWLAAFCLSASAIEKDTCPPRIRAAQTISSPKLEGWSNFDTNDEHPFVNVSFSAGPPDGKAILTPSAERQKGKLSFATWNFPKSETEYWVSCEYAETTVVVAKPLGRDITSCTAEYDTSFSRPRVNTWGCLPAPGKGK